MDKKLAVSFPPQDKSSGFHSTLLIARLMESSDFLPSLKAGVSVGWHNKKGNKNSKET
jgi:hypothetical protein